MVKMHNSYHHILSAARIAVQTRQRGAGAASERVRRLTLLELRLYHLIGRLPCACATIQGADTIHDWIPPQDD
jgi:hypothetical protein